MCHKVIQAKGLSWVACAEHVGLAARRTGTQDTSSPGVEVREVRVRLDRDEPAAFGVSVVLGRLSEPAACPAICLCAFLSSRCLGRLGGLRLATCAVLTSIEDETFHQLSADVGEALVRLVDEVVGIADIGLDDAEEEPMLSSTHTSQEGK